MPVLQIDRWKQKRSNEMWVLKIPRNGYANDVFLSFKIPVLFSSLVLSSSQMSGIV